MGLNGLVIGFVCIFMGRFASCSCFWRCLGIVIGMCCGFLWSSCYVVGSMRLNLDYRHLRTWSIYIDNMYLIALDMTYLVLYWWIIEIKCTFLKLCTNNTHNISLTNKLSFDITSNIIIKELSTDIRFWGIGKDILTLWFLLGWFCWCSIALLLLGSG